MSLTYTIVNPASRLVNFKGSVKDFIQGQYLTVFAAFKPGEPVDPYTPVLPDGTPAQSSPLIAVPDSKGDYWFYANVPAGVSAWFVAFVDPTSGAQSFKDGVAVSA